MHISSVRLFLNNPLVMIGSTDFVDDFAELPQESLDVVTGTHRHLAISARAQVAPVEISLWEKVRPSGGLVAFIGELDLHDGFISIFDIENSTRLTRRVGEPGNKSVAIVMDEARNASRIFIVLEPTDGEIIISDTPEYPLGGFTGTLPEPAGAAAQLGLVLSGYDHPLGRIISAIKIIFINAVDAEDRARAINFGRVQMLVEWMRWLNPRQPLRRYRELGSLIMERMSDEFVDTDSAAIEIAKEIWRAINS